MRQLMFLSVMLVFMIFLSGCTGSPSSSVHKSDTGENNKHVYTYEDLTKDSEPTPLINAVKALDKTTVIELLNNGSNVDEKNVFGETPLIVASGMGGSKEIVELLIEHGANINARSNNNFTALMSAVTVNNSDVSSLLIERGAHVNGAYILHNCADLNILGKLIIKGADLEFKDFYGRTALLDALFWEENDKAKVLIEAGADVNTRDRKGDTPLIISVAYQNKELVELLLSKGAKYYLCNQYSECPLTIAKAENDSAIVKMLQDVGAK